MICPIIDNPKLEYIYSLLFIAGGALTYIPFVRYNVEVPFLSKFKYAMKYFLDRIK